MIKRITAALVAVALGIGLSLVAATSAQAHTADFKVTAVCNTTTGNYDLTGHLILDAVPAGESGHMVYHVGNQSFSYNWDGSTFTFEGDAGTHGNGTVDFALPSISGTTVGTGPWTYVYTTFDKGDKFTIKSDNQADGLTGDCTTKDAAAAISVSMPNCQSASVATWTGLVNATGGTLDQTPGDHSGVATAVAHHSFPAGAGVTDGSTKTISYTIVAATSGSPCWPTDATASAKVTAPTCTTGATATPVFGSFIDHVVTTGQTTGPGIATFVFFAETLHKFSSGDVSTDGSTLTIAKTLAGPDTSLCPKLVPAVPEPKDTCGTDNDHYVLPTGPAGITYSRSARPGRDIIATITAANTYWGALPAGWVQNTATTATYAFDITKFTDVDCYPPVKCVLSGTSDTEGGDLPPVHGLAGLVFDGPTAVGQAKDIYFRVLSGNAQGISGMSVTYSGVSTVFPAQVVVEIWRNGVVGSDFATLSTNFSAAEATGTVDVQNSGEWYTSKIASGPGSLDWISTGHTETYAQLIANYPSNLLASAPSLHLQSNSPAGAHSVVSSLTSSCGPLGFSLVHVVSSVSHTNQTCNVDKNLVGGTITVGITSHVTYTIKDASLNVVPFDAGGATGLLAPGTYTVTATAASGYGLDPDVSGPVVISAYPNSCTKTISVTPGASNTNQICSEATSHLENGQITVAIKTGVVYEITKVGDATHALIPFDVLTGKTAALSPGSYTVHPSAESGYALTSAADIPLTITPYGGFCLQLITHPLVDPSSAQVQIGCNTSGSYTLSSDQVDATAVVWTVNGSTVAQGTYKVAAAGHYVINAAPGPGFGFAFDATTHWVYDFALPTTCDLKTLALTGTTPSGILVLAGFLTLFGLALLRRAAHVRKTVRS